MTKFLYASLTLATLLSAGAYADNLNIECVPRLQALCSQEFSSGCYDSVIVTCQNRSMRYVRCVEATFTACRQEYSSGCYENATSVCNQ